MNEFANKIRRKFLIFSIFFTLTSHSALFGQGVIHCFDDVPENCYINSQFDFYSDFYIDSASNPNNVWQVGVPQKTILNNAYSSPNVLITDTITSYPILDTSSFVIKFRPTLLLNYDWTYMGITVAFRYKVDSDTLVDFGKIEFSPDNETTWFNLDSDSSFTMWSVYDSVYISQQMNSNVILSGTSDGWYYAICNVTHICQNFNIQTSDTLACRFSFISDGVQTNRDGLMFDDIWLGISLPIGLVELDTFPNRTLLKILDLMGRETEDQPNIPLIYVYSDGTREKVFRVE